MFQTDRIFHPIHSFLFKLYEGGKTQYVVKQQTESEIHEVNDHLKLLLWSFTTVFQLISYWWKTCQKYSQQR